MTIQEQKFDRQFFRDVFQLLKPYWTSAEKWRAMLLLAATILCVIAQVRINVGINEFSNDFYTALQNFNKDVMPGLFRHFAFLVIMLILVAGYNVYFLGLLTVRWRRWLTNNYLQQWLTNQVFYRMQVFSKKLDNPDQRISEDLDAFTTSTLSLFIALFHSVLSLLSFGYVLWHLSSKMTLPFTTIHMPGYLLWSAMIYAGIGTWLIAFIGNRLAGLNYRQQQFNADFRFSMVRLRESGEQIAMQRGENFENSQFRQLFDRIFVNYIDMIKVQKKLMFFTNGYSMVSFVVGFIIGMPLYFAKQIPLGGLTQINGAFGEVSGALSVLINSFVGIAAWRAVVYRLTEFKQSMRSYEDQAQQSAIKFHSHSKKKLVASDLTLQLPDGSVLFNKLNLVVNGKESVLISGDSGLGKSTLLRALAGIWPYGEGEIMMPEKQSLLFLPQKPYLPLGKFCDAITYPLPSENFSEENLITILQICHLEKFLPRLQETSHWTQELSLGEQQLISFARVFLTKPDWVFLDEASSALDIKTEMVLYEKLREILPDMTIVSVGHRATLIDLHQRQIALTATAENTLLDEENWQTMAAKN